MKALSPQELYEVHRQTVLDLMGEDMGAWDSLDQKARTMWDAQSYEQNLRDRPLSVTLRELKGE